MARPFAFALAMLLFWVFWIACFFVSDAAAIRKERIKLFVAISSKFEYFHRRDMLRYSWLQRVSVIKGALEGRNVISYRFFTDYPLDEEEWAQFKNESSVNQDIVLHPANLRRGHYLPAYLHRGIFHMGWALEHFELDYYLRIDDDGFLCLHKLYHELSHGLYPTERFFMGKYHCVVDRGRTDENFMLLSQDIAHMIIDHQAILRTVPATFAQNFQYWLNGWNVTIFDDRSRLSAQTGYVSAFIHDDEPNEANDHLYATFCDTFLFAHHVTSKDIFKKVFTKTVLRDAYPRPNITSPLDVCSSKLRFKLEAVHDFDLVDLPEHRHKHTGG